MSLAPRCRPERRSALPVRARALAAAAVLMLFSGVAQAAPAESPLPKWVRKYTFHATGPGEMRLEGTILGRGRAAIYGSLAVTQFGGERFVGSSLVEWGAKVDAPRPYGVPTPVDYCGLGVSCTVTSTPDGITFTTTASATQEDVERHFKLELYVFGQGYLTVKHENLRQWRREFVRNGGFAAVDTRQSGSTGVSATGYHAEAFSGVTARASRPSFAIAPSPCSTAGAGILGLTGGAQPVQQLCPTDKTLTAESRAPTTWSVTGPAAGLSTRSTRLVVLDM